jgi:quercetin dioxygenase-like cupin family protein
MDFDHLDDRRGEAPAEHPARFQGDARIQALPQAVTGAAVFAVHFDAGGRSRPHVHRGGQILVVTSGRGVVGDEGGRRQVGPGDIIAAAPGEWHWHGATPDSPMTHVTVQSGTDDTIDWDVDERDWADGYR